MGEFSLLDDYQYAFPEDFYDETGEIDMQKLMELLEANPELMEQFQEMYEDDDTYLPADDYVYTSLPTLQDTYTDCILPNMSSALESIAPLLAACVLCSIITRCSTSTRPLSHILYSLLGLLVLYRFFQENILILVMYTTIACGLIQSKFLRTRLAVISSLFSLVYVIACEFLISPERWHNVRGAQMILSMKVISLSIDLSNEKVKSTSIPTTLSYLLHPGNVIFGPWIPYQYYIDSVSSLRGLLDWEWMVQIYKSCLLSGAYLLWSSCIASYILPHFTIQYGRWAEAYREAQSFRFSHYFVCSLSEMTLLLSGVASFSSAGELTSHTKVSQPINIELPRSLVEVVTSWNLPMHKWLKNYVFKVVKPSQGVLTAIFATYMASSLLHGLNFQLAAVLLSLGFYSYTEHSLRHTLANTFNLCVEAKKCLGNPCPHRYGHYDKFSVMVNVSFTCLAMYHLAYLGVMFDTSETEQERGYSMLHTLSKWENLGYSSHMVALCTYCFYWLIK